MRSIDLVNLCLARPDPVADTESSLDMFFVGSIDL